MMQELKENPQAGALGWLLEMELLNNPTVLNSMILNVFKMNRGIKDAEFIIDVKDKKLLVYLELKWFHRKFKKSKVEAEVTTLLDQIVPFFQKRVVFDKTILAKATEIVKLKKMQELGIFKNESKNSKDAMETPRVP